MKEETKKNSIELVEIPLQMGMGYQLPDGTIIKSMEEAMLWMMNVVWEIKKSIA